MRDGQIVIFVLCVNIYTIRKMLVFVLCVNISSTKNALIVIKGVSVNTMGISNLNIGIWSLKGISQDITWELNNCSIKSYMTVYINLIHGPNTTYIHILTLYIKLYTRMYTCNRVIDGLPMLYFWKNISYGLFHQIS